MTETYVVDFVARDRISPVALGISKNLERVGDSGQKLGAEVKSGAAQGEQALKRLGREADATAKSVSDKFNAAGDKMQGIAGKLSLGVTAPLLALGTAAQKAASDVSEAANKVDVVFGASAVSVQKWAETTAGSIGQSKRSALEAAGSFGSLFRTIGISEPEAAKMSMTMVKLASDLASFHNADPSEVILAMGSAFRGESEPISRFGVLMNDATLKAQALKMGLISNTKDALEPGVKAQAAYGLILAQTTLAQGDFARTATGAANAQRIAKAEFEDAAAKLGEHLLPIGRQVIGMVTGLVQAFNKLSPAQQKTIVTIGLVAAAAGPVIGVLGTLSKIIGAVQAAWLALTGVRAATTAAIGAHTAALGANTVAAEANTLALGANNAVAGAGGAARGFGGLGGGLLGRLGGVAGRLALPVGIGVAGVTAANWLNDIADKRRGVSTPGDWWKFLNPFHREDPNVGRAGYTDSLGALKQRDGMTPRERILAEQNAQRAAAGLPPLPMGGAAHTLPLGATGRHPSQGDPNAVRWAWTPAGDTAPVNPNRDRLTGDVYSATPWQWGRQTRPGSVSLANVPAIPAMPGYVNGFPTFVPPAVSAAPGNRQIIINLSGDPEGQIREVMAILRRELREAEYGAGG